MPNERVQVNPLAPAPQLTPQATPVDTFHRPDEPLLNQGPSQTAQLFAALGHAAPSIFQYADIQHAEQTQEQMSAGELAVLNDKRIQNRKALKEAVTNGTIPAAKNPWFMQGMRQQVYRIEGEKYDQALREAYAKSESRNQDDISDFVGGFTSKYIEGIGADPSDPEVARIFTPAVARSQANILQVHKAQREAAIEQTAYDNTDIEVGLTLDNMSQGGMSPDFAAKSISGVIEEHIKNGLDGTKVNELLAHSIARKAEEQLDTSYLDLLDKIPAGSGMVGQIGAVKDIRSQAESRIYKAIEERDRVNSKLAKAQTDEDVKAGLADIFTTIQDHPGADVKDKLKALAKLDPEAAQKAYGWTQAEINGADNVVEDENEVVSLTSKVFSGNGRLFDIMEARSSGLISKQTASKLAENIDRSKEFRSVMRDPIIQQAHKVLGEIIRKTDTGWSDADAINASRAQNTFAEGMANWKQKNPDAGELDTIQQARRLQKELVDLYSNEGAVQAGNSLDLNFKSALIADPASVDWKNKPLFTPDELRKAAQESDATQGKAGTLAQLAAHLECSVKDLASAQVKLLNAKAKEPKAAPKK